MIWTPNYAGEPYSFPEGLSGGLIPFTPHDPNRGALQADGAASGVASVTFQSVLIPTGEECLEESIKLIWLFGRRLRAENVTIPDEDWEAWDVTNLPDWPGTCVQLISPPEFRGRVVTLGLDGVTRMVALMEWRGEPPDITVDLEGS